MCSHSSDATGTDNCDNRLKDIEYDYDPVAENFLQLDNIVQYLFSTGLLNDIECRKIVIHQGFDVVKIRAAIFEILLTKNPKTLINILDVFRKRVHPFQNPNILLRIFSYLKYAGIEKFKCVSPDWKQIIDLILKPAFDQVNLEQILRMNLLSWNEKIQNTETPYKDGKKASVFQLMLAANPENDEIILETLQIGRNDPPDVNNSSIKVFCTAENRIDNIIANALSNRNVLSNLFQFLPHADIKNCQAVCHTWNSVSEPFLRKNSTIKFDSKLSPKNFINVAKYQPLPRLPFTAFKFRKIFSTEELSEFFSKYGKTIRSLDIWLAELGMDPPSCLSQLTNLTELDVQGTALNRRYSNPEADPMTMIPWSSLHSIKILDLRNTIIQIDTNKEWTRIMPLKVHFEMVKFFVGDFYPDEITLNDYIDFSKVTDVVVTGTKKQIQQFDWAKDIFAAKTVTFSNTLFVNAGESKAAVNYLKLDCQHPFSEKNCMSIKQLLVNSGSISLASLPPSLEKFGLLQNFPAHISSSEPIYLPNLNYLSYRKKDFHLLSNFDNCPRLTDMEIVGVSTMDLRWLPRNIKRLKLESCSGQLQLLFVGGLTHGHYDLDLLILNSVGSYCLKFLKFDKLRPKVLVLEICGAYEDNDFVSFIRRNKNMDKIYIQFQSSIRPIRFNTTELSKIADKESQYYEFSNQRGKAITSEEFKTIHKSLDIKTVMNVFWNSDEKRQRNAEYQKRYYINRGLGDLLEREPWSEAESDDYPIRRSSTSDVSDDSEESD